MQCENGVETVRCQCSPGAVLDKTWSCAVQSQCGHGPVCEWRQTGLSAVLVWYWSREAAMYRSEACAGPEQPVRCWCRHEGEMGQSRG